MGQQCILFGYIESADPGHAGGEEENILKNRLREDMLNHNLLAIDKLPIEDLWPPLSKKMFHSVPNDYLLTYKNSILVFGGSFKSICREWPEWIRKFENLLEQMYWESSTVTLKSEMVGTHQLHWKPKREWVKAMCDRRLDRIENWDFKGVRDFNI